MALLTRHGKGTLIAPVLSSIGWHLLATDAFDTDSLGSFSGEIERRHTPLECARQKAQLACELTGLEFGLGSEVVEGLRCRWCDSPTELPQAFIWCCNACLFEQTEANTARYAEPGQCPWFNP